MISHLKKIYLFNILLKEEIFIVIASNIEMEESHVIELLK